MDEPGDDRLLDEAIDRWMRERPAPRAPDGFTRGVMARLRQERWQAERYWDLAFNIALAAGVALVAAGVLALVYMSGLSVVARDAVLLFGQALTTVAGRVAPSLPTYAAAFALTATALGLWWWAENF